MTTARSLVRSYGLLLRAYPRWYRRDRAAEILTTLMDAAGPGQRRPTGRDMADLIVSGLRFRLRPPRGTGYWLVLAAVLPSAALAGLIVAGLLAMPAAVSRTQVTTAAAALSDQAPLRTADAGARCDWCPNWDTGPLPPGRSGTLAYPASGAEVARSVRGMYDRLATAGWRVDPAVIEDQDDGTVSFAAERDGTRIAVVGHLGQVYLDKDLSRPDPQFVPITAVVTRGLPALTGPALVAGVLAGMLAGWLLTAWVLHRFQRHRTGVRLLLAIASAVVLPVTCYAGVWAAQSAAVLAISGNWTARWLMVPANLAAFNLPAIALAALAVLAVAGIAALPQRSTRQPANPAATTA